MNKVSIFHSYFWYMTYIILVYYIFTSDITYLSFAAITRCSIPVEKPPAFLSERLDLTIVP